MGGKCGIGVAGHGVAKVRMKKGGATIRNRLLELVMCGDDVR